MPTEAGLAKARELYLQHEYRTQYNPMKADGTLQPHLEMVGMEAEEKVVQMQNHPEPVDYAERVKSLQTIPEVVRELVYHDWIIVPPPTA